MWRAVLSWLPRLSNTCLHAPAAKMVHTYVPRYYRPWMESRWLPYAAAALVLPQMAYMEEGEAEDNGGWRLLGLSSRRRVFFKYEKRIRELSPPDKVFDYFASVSQSGSRMYTLSNPDFSRLMTPADLLNSLVAVYPPEGTQLERSGALKGDRQSISAQLPGAIKGTDFFDQFDTDGDGYICFGEYLLIVTFLAIPLEDVDIIFSMFDDDDSGAISLAEFLHVTSSLQRRLHHVSPIKRTGLQTEAGEEGHGLLITFFGEDGKEQLDLKHFSDFCRALHAELLWLEFLHYDHAKKGYISGGSFAHSLVSHARMQDIDQYLTAIDSMPEALKKIKVSWEQFQSVALLRQSAHRLAVALDFFFSTEGKIGKEDFGRAVTKVLGHGLPPLLVDIIFGIYATDDGHLKYRDLLYSMQKREGNMLYSKQMLELDPTMDNGIFACLRGCLTPGRGS